MMTVSHSSCLVLNVIPARVFVEERLDETVACPNDDTIVSASPPPQTFFYSPVGDAESVKRFLGPDLARTVQCDGTSVTTFLERTGGKRSDCWAHARRRLVEATRAGDRIAFEGVRIIARLFAVERDSTCAGDNAEQRRERRARCSRPILDELRSWLDDQRAVIPPKTPLGKGLGYLDRQWPRLQLFLEDGNIEATNNRRERELRRLVLGRKTWLFAWLD